ncbi:VWA domain-containing protein [Brevibacillus sp. NL20B1]|jgi:Ca-activated chloride channel family protein|nr:VWA domain-containing protein [Brevibacillus sp. NL20B1]MBR8658930.1 VWA domain-containing protein [Brevibacillus sp. NL20B1]NNV04444.1 VWA domain-containing protein [Brevibacillus sp. MCWH]
MKANANKLLSALLACLLVLSACSSDQEKPADSNAPDATTHHSAADHQAGESPVETPKSREEKIQQLKSMIPEGLTKLPETAEEFYKQPPGRFAGVPYGYQSEEIKKVLQQFPNIENPDSEIIELYYLALLGLFAEDYPEPEEIINQIKLSSFGSRDMDDPRYQFKEQYNVMIVLDASGSMGHMAGSKTRMEAAKEAIRSFAASLPAGARVGLRVYGHEGTGSEVDKARSCSKSDVMYPLQAYDKQKLDSALAQFKPAGWTPIALALEQAQKDLQAYKGEKSTNIIYLVSDGIETCGGDPVQVAKQLADSDVTPIVNVVGFGVDGEAQRQLKAVAEAAKGRYVLIQDQKELEKEFEQAEKIADKWWKWKSGASYDAFSKHLSQSLEILHFGFIWDERRSRESYNLFSAFLHMEGKILDNSTIAKLEELEKTQNQLSQQRGRELETFLESLNDKTYTEAIDAIIQKYSENVKEE